MAGDRVSIPQLCGENWSTWKAKFRGLFGYKGWLCAVKEPKSVEKKKVSSQARGLMLIHTEDAYGDAHAPAMDRGRVARTVSKKGQSGPIVETMREVVEVSEEIGKGKESPQTAVESKPAGVEQATEKLVMESHVLGRCPARVRREPAEWYRANVGATEAVEAEELEHGVEKMSPEKSDDGDSGGVWVTPKAKKTARKRSATS
ncbi:hypothetical protein KFL_013160030 [Klebsormidium nitens]|uniref:Uncharacterized protein n=1 Tax=Klebsormidium nitens TaxID=105231 RepID=A0A1Y1IQJ2_KLENI|nr:hypothetical protein KFL_013160030 [Klebsormidium nitens]|eukprot:GAQ93130.1 hypothetical protein KFL_013160030 [Klebsormidium nitens]